MDSGAVTLIFVQQSPHGLVVHPVIDTKLQPSINTKLHEQV